MGSKSSRHYSDNGEALSKETIDELCQDTGFTEEELLTWHTNFYKDCPDGKLTLKQFEHEYSKIMGKPTQKTSDYVKHMFNVYDQDKNQFIDFKEFVMALSAASAVNRLRLVETLFSIFDLDANGKISKDEMGRMLQTLVEVTGSNKERHHHHHHHHHRSNEYAEPKEINLQKRIDDAFNELNTNDDDFITKDEFIEWYIKSGLLSDVKSNEINVPDTSRIQQLDKKSRKIRKQQLNTNNKEENHHSHPQFIRYMSHMSEQKSIPIIYNNDNEIIDDNPIACQKRHSDDNDSHYSKENERWQHLFNSVLGQIRAQRRQEIENQQQQQQEINPNGYNRKSHFNSWKQQGEEKLKLEYYRQKTNDYTASPDIITIRL